MKPLQPLSILENIYDIEGQHNVQTWGNGGPNSAVWHEWWIKSYSWRLTKTWQTNYTPLHVPSLFAERQGARQKLATVYLAILIGLSFCQSMLYHFEKKTAQISLYNSLGRHYSQQISWMSCKWKESKIWPSVLNRSNLHLFTQKKIVSVRIFRNGQEFNSENR